MKEGPVEFNEERLNQLKKLLSNDKGTGRENEMLLHCYREAYSLNGKGSEVWSVGSVCFK